MVNRRRIERRGFWALALLWLPAGVFATAAVLFWTAPTAWTPMLPESAASLATWVGLGAVTAPLVAGLPGPLEIAAWAFALSLPAWVAWWWLPVPD